jgi:preprotein translocase subunit SecE
MQGNEKTGKSQVKSWFQGLKSEFNKIVWTDRNTLAKQTVAVTVITVILAVLISIMDTGILQVINLLMK